MKIFTDHPADVGETYTQHMGVSFSFGWRLVAAGIGCMLHGLFPWVCTKTGSKAVNRLHHEMCTHRDRRPEAEQNTSSTKVSEAT